MKTYKKVQNGEVVQMVGLFGKGALAMEEGELFDDCEICRMLKRGLETGEIVEVAEGDSAPG